MHKERLLKVNRYNTVKVTHQTILSFSRAT